jgi:hypothetical protein
VKGDAYSVFVGRNAGSRAAAMKKLGSGSPDSAGALIMSRLEATGESATRKGSQDE